jgi:hypothetical protein
MTQRVWNGTSQGRWLDDVNWTNGAPLAGDTWFIAGAGDAPVVLGGIFEINNNPIVDLYGPSPVPSLIDDPDPSLIPTADPIVSPDIVVAGGTAVVGMVLIDSTIASATTLSVTGIAVMQANYTDTLAGTISIQPTTGAAPDANGNNGELDLQIFPIGSVDPNTFTKRDYTPVTTNTGTIEGGAGAGFHIGMEGATPQLNNLDGVLQVLGGYDAFVNTGTIALADSSMQVQGGFYAGDAQYNAFFNNGLISLGPANPGANPYNLNTVVPGSAYFDTQISGTGTVALTGQGAAQAGAEFLGGIAGNTVVVADATASFFHAGFSLYAYSGAFVFADNAGTLSIPIALDTPFLPISGFQAGDAITVRNAGTAPVLSWDQASNQLVISNDFGGGAVVAQATLTVEGTYSLSDFTPTVTNGADITVTTDALACFAAGTRIATPDGMVAVEHLRAGDRVLTSAGGVRPVTWTGSRAIDCAAHAEPDKVRPVRVRADAITPGVPARDVLLSPDHALFVDGLLIPVRLLLNGRTIAVAHEVRHVTYHHVRLDSHDVILADGLPAESFLDVGHADWCAPDAPLAASDGDRAALSCAPFAVDAARVRPIWERLAGPAPVTPDATLTDDPALCLVCDGRVVRASAVSGARYRFDVRGARRVRIVSRAMRPSDRHPWLDDRRMLGVKIRDIVAQGTATQRIARTGDAAGRGWHADEADGRWTDGNAELALPAGTAVLEMAIGRLDAYPASAAIGRGFPFASTATRMNSAAVTRIRSR